MVWYQRWWQFLLEVRNELKRTTWPSQIEVRNTTLVVLVTIFIFAFFLGIVDLALGSLLQQVLEHFATVR